MPGVFTFRPLEANLTHNTDLLTKMNPYCSFILGNQKFNSQICKKGGKHPHWSDAVTIPASNETIAVVELMDKDRLTKDDVIGGCSINLQEIQSQGSSRNWYPLFYKNKPAGEILLETTFSGSDLGFASGNLASGSTGFVAQEQTLLASNQTNYAGETLASETIATGTTGITENRRIFTEQHQVVEPHTFLKNVEVTETVPVQKTIEVLEPRKVVKTVEYTEAVPVMKQIEVAEPQVVMKEVEVIEPRLVTKTIQVVENVPVKKQVEVVEMRHEIRNVETFEPQTFTKQVEVTEQVPVMRTVTVTEPVTVQKAVEFVEPVITTQTITKEIVEPVIINQTITQEVGPATVIGIVSQELMIQQRSWTEQQRLGWLSEQRLLQGQWSEEQRNRWAEEQRLRWAEDARLYGLGGQTSYKETRTEKTTFLEK